MKINRISRFITYNLIALLYSWTIVFSITYSMNFELSKQSVLKYCLAAIFVLNILFANQIIMFSGMGLLICAGVYYGYQVIEHKLLQKLYPVISEFFVWMYDYAVGIQYLNRSFSLYFTIILVLIISGITFLLVLKRYNFYILLVVGLAYYLVTINLGFKVYYPGLSIYLFCMICLFGREMFNKRIKHLLTEERQDQGYLYVLWIMPFAVLVVLLASSVSIENKYRRPQWIDKGVTAFNDWYDKQNWFEGFGTWQGSDFSLVSTGFQPNRNAIGGNIKLNDRLVLNVKADHRIYLKGSIRDYYTGKGWISKEIEEFSIGGNNIDEYITDSYFSSDRLFFDMLRRTRYRRLNYQAYQQVFQHGSAQVEHVGFRTNTLFYPDNITKLLEYNNDKTYLAFNNNGEFYFPGKIRNDNKYSFEYRIVDRSNPIAEEFLRRSSPEVIRTSLGGSESLRKKYDEINSKYTVGDNITRKVSALALEITKDYKNRYDKVEAIEKYLSSNYTYTLTPGLTPEGKDFVEYFLFDLKKGYCTYYASAMTLMARSLGIPARYVEGYVLPAGADSEGVYKVTNELSHAWVEVFFEGFGWVRFEPTSPFNALLSEQQNQSQEIASDIINDGEDYEEYLESIMGENDLEPELPQNNQAIDRGLAFLKDKTMLVVSITMLILSLILLIVTVRRIIFKMNVSKIKRQHAKRSIIRTYHMIIKLMHLYNYDMKPGETPLEYARRIDDWFIIGSSTFYDITELYTKAKYSKNSMTDEDKKKVLDYYHGVVKDLKSYLNVVWFYYYKYVKLEY